MLPCDRPQSPQASFASDLAQLQSAARMWSPAVLGEVKELVHHFNAELSFEREALMMDTVATNLEAARFSRVAVPDRSESATGAQRAFGLALKGWKQDVNQDALMP